MQLTNKQVTYTVSNESDAVDLNGNINLDANNRVTQFSGNFIVDGEFAGDFYYSETQDGKINKSMNSVPESVASAACDFLESTVAEIKTELEN